MALALETFFNFESGMFGELALTKNFPTIVVDPAPPYEHEARTAACLQAVAGKSLTTHSFPEGANDYAIGFYVRFTNVNATPGYAFAVIQGNVVDFHMQLRVNAGKLEVLDADSNVVATSASAVFTNNTWHLVELLFTFGDPGNVIVHVDEVEAVTANNEKFDCGAGTILELYLGGQGGFVMSVTDVYFAGGYVYSGASSVADFLGPFGSLTYRHDEDSATPDIGDVLDSGKWGDAAEIPFNDTSYAEYTTNGDEGVVTTDPGGCVAAIPGPYGDSRIRTYDVIHGASWVVRKNHAATFIFHFGKTPNDEAGVDNTSEINLGSSGVASNHLIVSEAVGDVPTTDEYFQYGLEATTPVGFPPTWKMYDCLCSLLIELGTRGITLGCGLAGRDKSRNILVG